MPRRAQQPARALRGSREIVPLGLPSARALGLARPPRSNLAHVRSCTARQRCLHPRTHNSREPPIALITLFIFPLEPEPPGPTSPLLYAVQFQPCLSSSSPLRSSRRAGVFARGCARAELIPPPCHRRVCFSLVVVSPGKVFLVSPLLSSSPPTDNLSQYVSPCPRNPQRGVPCARAADFWSAAARPASAARCAPTSSPAQSVACVPPPHVGRRLSPPSHGAQPRPARLPRLVPLVATC